MKMIAIFDTILREISEMKTKRVVLKIIKVIVINQAIAEVITNFLKTRLTYSF